MEPQTFDLVLSVIDIIICLADIALMTYLFFYKFPQEQDKKFKGSKILRKKRLYRP
jgi:hypothetical protein